MSSETKRLDNIASDSLYTTISNIMTIEYSFKIFERFLRPGSILELGPAEGIMTEHLYKLNRELTLVDGSEIFCSELKQKFPGTKVIESLFEDFKTDEVYENIIMGHVLEHVEDPVAILAGVRDILRDILSRIKATNFYLPSYIEETILKLANE